MNKQSLSKHLLIALMTSFLLISESQANNKEFVRILVETAAGKAYLQTVRGAKLVEELLGSGARITTGTDIQKFVTAFRNKATDEQIARAVLETRQITEAYAKSNPLAHLVEPNTHYQEIMKLLRTSDDFQLLSDLPQVFPQSGISLSLRAREFTRVNTTGNRVLSIRKKDRVTYADDAATDRISFYAVEGRQYRAATEAVDTRIVKVTEGVPRHERDLYYQATVKTASSPRSIFNLDATLVISKKAPRKYRLSEEAREVSNLMADSGYLPNVTLQVTGDLGSFQMLYIKSRVRAPRGTTEASGKTSYYHYFYERVVGVDGQVYYVLARAKQLKRAEGKVGFAIEGTSVEFKVIKETEEGTLQIFKPKETPSRVGGLELG